MDYPTGQDNIIIDAIRIRDAIRNPGPEPAYHRRIYRKHRREWPLLWARLDSLLASLADYEKDIGIKL